MEVRPACMCTARASLPIWIRNSHTSPEEANMVLPTNFQRSSPSSFTVMVEGYNMGAHPARAPPVTGDFKITEDSCGTCTYTIQAVYRPRFRATVCSSGVLNMRGVKHVHVHCTCTVTPSTKNDTAPDSPRQGLPAHQISRV